MDPKNRRSFIALLGIAAIDNFGFAIVFVMFAPFFLSPEYHFFPENTSIVVRTLYLAILFATYPLTQFFGAPFFGDLADRFGRKKSLVVSVIGTAAGFILSGIACLFTSVGFLIFSRLFSGFFAGNLTICLSGIADVSPTEKIRSRNFGILATAWALSWNLAMLTGGYLSDPKLSAFFSPSLPFWITAALTLISLAILALYYTETHKGLDPHPFDFLKGIHNIGRALKLHAVRPFFLTAFFWTIGWGLAVQWYADYVLLTFQATQLEISWSFFVQGVFWAIGGSVVNPLLIRKFSSLVTSLFGFLICAIFLALSAFATTMLSFSLLFWIASLFSAFGFSNVLNLASIHAPENIQGKIMGISQSFMAVGWVIVPMVGASMGSNYLHFFYPFSATLVFIAFLFLFTSWRVSHKA